MKRGAVAMLVLALAAPGLKVRAQGEGEDRTGGMVAPLSVSTLPVAGRTPAAGVWYPGGSTTGTGTAVPGATRTSTGAPATEAPTNPGAQEPANPSNPSGPGPAGANLPR